jgi:hypothetical protein
MNLLSFYSVGLGIFFGIMWGGFCGRPYGTVATIAGWLVGGACGLGLALLHRRLVLWLAPEDQADYVFPLRGPLARICNGILELATIAALIGSWFGTFLTVALLVHFPQKTPHPGDWSRGEIIAAFSSVTLASYLVLWTVGRVVDWMQSRHRPPDQNKPG